MSQEAEILNLLYRGQREAFESRLQQFRRLQLSQSKLGKAKLCRLINNVIQADGKYATVLIEDVSNMLNDSDAVVRNGVIATFAKSAHMFIFHIILARALYPTSDVARDALADLRCALSLVQHAATGTDSSESRLETTTAAVPYMLHMSPRSPMENGMKIIMMQLAFFAQLGVEPRTSDGPTSHHDSTAKKGSAEASVAKESTEPGKSDRKQHVNRNFTDEEWLRIITSDKMLMAQLGTWSREAVNFLYACICSAIKSETPVAKKRSLLAAEVAATLVSRYPHQYFRQLAPALIAAHTHLFRTSKDYEVLILRVFTSELALDFHAELAAMLNDAGYSCTLPELYKRAHTTAAWNRNQPNGEEKVVIEDDGINLVSLLTSMKDPDELFQLAIQDYGGRPPDGALREIKAAQIFEYEPAVIQHMNQPTEMFDCSKSELRLSHAKSPEEPPNLSYEDGINPEYSMTPVEAYPVPVTCETIRQHHILYSQLVATQMMDTVVSYTWHLRTTVLFGGDCGTFNSFNRLLFNKLFLSGLMKRSTQLELFSELMDHLAQMTLIDIALAATTDDPSRNPELTDACDAFSAALTDAKNAGVSELMEHVVTQRRSTALEVLLACINELLMNKACMELARGVIQGRKEESKKELILPVKTADNPENEEPTGNSHIEERVSYADLVELTLEKLYKSRVLEIVEIRDSYVLQICRFILNMPFIPLTIVNLIDNWLLNPSSRRLAFSLVSNILKKWHCPHLKEHVLAIFLRTLVSNDPEIRSLFLRLVASPKGIYQPNSEDKKYSIASLESLHSALLDWIRLGGGCTKCGVAPNIGEAIIRDCNAMANRPLWQWPRGLIKAIDKHSDAQGNAKHECKGCEWNKLKEAILGSSTYIISEDLDWTTMSSVWLEEVFALLAKPGSLKAHPFVEGMMKALIQGNTEKSVYEPIVTAAWKNGSLVPFVCEITEMLDETALRQARRSCCMHVAEIVNVLKYNPELDPFLVTLLSDLRIMWLDPKCQLLDIWRQEPPSAKLLVETALSHLESCEAYAMEMVPFMAVEQLEKLVTHLFSHGSEENLKRVLALMLEVPPTFRKEQKELYFALPQHFMYQCYNIKPCKEGLRRQTGILDHCVDCCVRGQLTVQSALSACTLIVENTEDISFVFGRVLCQLVQRVSQTRGVVVQSILPTLFQREAWKDKMLWRGVVICMGTLWPSHKEQLCRLLLLLPQEQGEPTLKTLQAQHNIIAFMESALPQLDHTVYIPEYIKQMLSM